MDTRRTKAGRQEGRTIPEATPPGREESLAEQRGKGGKTVTLCYSHSKESAQGNRTGPEPDGGASPPTTQSRSRRRSGGRPGRQRRTRSQAAGADSGGGGGEVERPGQKGGRA